MKDEKEAISQRPRPGATRCPFCHESCESDTDACACAECLSRHHRGCWSESRGCASCRGTRLLEPAKPKSDAPGYAEAIDAWLKLALVYNGGLSVLSLMILVARGRLLSPVVLMQVVFGAILANICFAAGPGAELLARRLGYRGTLLRWLIFLAGFGIALLLALISCATV